MQTKFQNNNINTPFRNSSIIKDIDSLFDSFFKFYFLMYQVIMYLVPNVLMEHDLRIITFLKNCVHFRIKLFQGFFFLVNDETK